MKLKFLSLTSFFGIAVVSVLSLATTNEFVQALSNSYYQSCDAEQIGEDYLKAHCRTKGGGFERASIKLRGIHNIDGRLVQNILRADSSFQDSCKNTSIDKGLLQASCKNSRGGDVRSSIRLEEISNNDGNLVYEMDDHIRRTSHKIGHGHSYAKHKNEFKTDKAIPTKGELSRIAQVVISNKEEEKNLINARKAYWKTINPSKYIRGRSKPKGTIVIIDPRNRDQGTIFVPSRGKSYFDSLR